MIRIGSEFIFWSVAFFVVMLIFDGFDIALQSTMFIIGMIMERGCMMLHWEDGRL